VTVERFNPGVLKFCAALGPGFTLMWLIGAGPLSHFVYLPPPSAANTAAQTVATYTDNLTQVRLGCVLMIFASSAYAFWGVAVSMYGRKAEQGRPVLFYSQIVCLAVSVVVIMLIGCSWGVAAFRPGETLPEVTQGWNDFGWFAVLFTSAPFTGWALALGFAIVLDKSARPAFPRWVGYFNIWAAIFFCPACLMLFFKTGPFSQNGIFVFYIPVGIFFVWIVVLSVLTVKAINAEARELRLGLDAQQDSRPHADIRASS